MKGTFKLRMNAFSILKRSIQNRERRGIKMKEKQEIIRLRNHFSYIFEQAWHWLVLFVCILFSSEDSMELGLELIRKGNIVQGILAMGGMLFVLLIICVWYLNRWYRTTITIQDGTITSAKVTLNRRINTMSVSNISNINLEQNLFEMLVGTYKLKIDTNSLSTADTTDLEILLKKKQAEEVRQLLLAMLREGKEEADPDAGKAEEVSAAADEFDIQQGEYDVVYSDKEIVKNALITISVTEFIGALGMILLMAGTVAAIFREEKDILAILGTLLLQFILTGSVVADLVRKCLQNFHFRAKRHKDKIYVACGLLKKKSYVVPVDKINAVTLKYSFIGRICKRAYVKVINIGGQGQEADGMKFLLTDSYEELERKLHILLPEFQLPEIERMVKPPKRLMGMYRVYSIVCAIAAFAVLECVLALMGENGMDGMDFVIGILTGIVAGGLHLYFCYMKYRASGILYTDSNFILSRGIFTKTIQTIPYDRIQFVHMKQGPVMRKLGLLEGNVSILASALSQTQYMGIFDNRDFARLEEKFRETY